MNIYDFKVKDAKHNEVDLSEYRGNVLLVVNTATGCGFTPQYEGLEALYQKHKDRGFEILDFPCNQFLGQAPGSNEEIASFCQLNYGTSFRTFSKIEVNGKNADPLFVHLKGQAPRDHEDGEAGAFKKVLQSISHTVLGDDIKWNFTKFLVDREGNVVDRFAPTWKPEDIEPAIEKLLWKEGSQ
ncbi:glutathione peroxidase [Anaerotalea alkaliphila]|uniref:Glutathione peroxidase n=1 Tax=Anaerotalea alkaliphila TaxID=2662126 RepID=A0A7X5HXD3_9FIRM|nr:glutathione peroxidase [Anaerotalea alkaliphila]NDL68412.1 glutathione peroxidase [Anaerotalea alkaliphila]